MIGLPALCVLAELLADQLPAPTMYLIGKWFIFWGIGVRLFTAGLKQVINPAFTAASIFHLKEKESQVVVRELGYANICLGIIGIVSLFIPHWRIVAACSGGLFFGIAGANHLIKKPAGINELIAMVSDVFIALVVLLYAVFR
jgi:hypothetical protein